MNHVLGLVFAVALVAPPEILPRAETSTATPGLTTAIVTGNVDAHGVQTTAYFQYGLTTSYGLVTDVRDVGTWDAVLVTARAVGLACGTTYHFRLVAANATGTTFGDDAVFETLPCSPALSEVWATDITATSAVLHVFVNPGGRPTVVWMVISGWWDSTSLAPVWMSQNAGSGTTMVELLFPVTGLACGLQYAFHATAWNGGGLAPPPWYYFPSRFSTLCSPAPTASARQPSALAIVAPGL